MKKVLQLGALVLLSGILAQNPSYDQKDNQEVSQTENNIKSDKTMERLENNKEEVEFDGAEKNI